MPPMQIAAAEDFSQEPGEDALLNADSTNAEDATDRGGVIHRLQGVKRGVAIGLFLVLALVLFCYVALVPPASPRSTVVVTDEVSAEVIGEWGATLPFDQWVKAFKVSPGEFQWLLYNVYKNHPTFLKEKGEMDSMVQWQQSHSCPQQILNENFLTGIIYKLLYDAPTAAHCQKACTETITPKCAVWSFQLDTRQCRLKLFNAQRHVRKVHHVGMVSGYPCQQGTVGAWWPTQDHDFYMLPQPALPQLPIEPRRCKGAVVADKCDSTGGDCCAPLTFQEEAKCTGGLVAVREDKGCDGWTDGAFTCCEEKDVTQEPTDEMLCVALFMPYSYEQELLIMQNKENAGIFQCDKHVLYSSQVIELIPGVVSRRLPSSMRAEPGGQYSTVLNLGTFLALYRQMITDRDYVSAGWIIKVDPDTVFFPHRLRPLLHSYNWGVGGAGIFLNNCPEGLHGPIEILSQNAFISFAHGLESCYRGMNNIVCNDECQRGNGGCVGQCTSWWGEDIFLDQCLIRFTKARRVFAKQLLQEDHCPTNQRTGWASCEDTDIASFHPFKDPPKWIQCWKSAIEKEDHHPIHKGKHKSHRK